MSAEPLYHFGHGLSYTTFNYSNMRLNKGTISPNDSVEVSVDVTNSGERASDEVVQLYVRDREASVPVPLQHLEGFRRIHLKAREKQTVKFTLTPAQLACYDDAGKPFVESGVFEIFINNSAISTDLTVR
jgi:beta-glucosidase